MEKQPVISLCIPTNGVIEWVFPVIESIYSQGVDNRLFEVVVTDNGKNEEFKRKISKYKNRYSNFIYEETNALPFVNEIEAYKRASGVLIKFVNHRTLLVEGALKKLIDYATVYEEDRPIIYFSNGVLDADKAKREYHTFDEFIRGLSYWSSWSTGMAIWKEDLAAVADDREEYNELFPHTNILFKERNRKNYVIDNSIIFDEMSPGKKAKGKYDLYYAFGIEYPMIIEKLYTDGSIEKNTRDYVLKKNLELIASFYWDYNIRKNYCSYDITGFNNMFGKYYNKHRFNGALIKIIFRKIKGKIYR